MRNRITFTIAIVTLIALMAGLVSAQQTPTETPAPLPTNLPTITPYPTSTVSPTPGCASPLNLAVGALAYVSGGVDVRYKPDVSSALMNYYAEKTAVRITDGPVCNNNYNWWQVRGPGEDGWVAEGRPGSYWMGLLEPPEGFNCAPAQDLTVGKRARILRDLKLHQDASEDALVLTIASQNSLVDVLEGPKCIQKANWWLVRTVVLKVVYIGWVAELDAKGYLLEDENERDKPVCAPPLRLKIGGRGYVDFRGQSLRNLRVAPDQRSQLVASLIDGIGFEVIGGPFCAKDSMNWWNIRILSRPDVSGWLAEGGPPNYWIAVGSPLATPTPLSRN
jgi:hypothetical protein